MDSLFFALVASAGISAVATAVTLAMMYVLGWLLKRLADWMGR